VADGFRLSFSTLEYYCHNPEKAIVKGERRGEEERIEI